MLRCETSAVRDKQQCLNSYLSASEWLTEYQGMQDALKVFSTIDGHDFYMEKSEKQQKGRWRDMGRNSSTIFCLPPRRTSRSEKTQGSPRCQLLCLAFSTGLYPSRLQAARGRQTSLETTLSEFNYHSNQNYQHGDSAPDSSNPGIPEKQPSKGHCWEARG